MKQQRRDFLKAAALGVPALSLGSIACAKKTPPPQKSAPPAGGSQPAAAAALPEPPPPPASQPSHWDAVAYNLQRGANGAIPESYMKKIQAADGIQKHLGKHLPYRPQTISAAVPAGFLPVMWGDPAKGFAMHPNAGKSEKNPEGHWYNWIKVAIDGKPDTEIVTKFDNWPQTSSAVNGKLVDAEGKEITAERSKQTVYLAELPKGLSGEVRLRVWAHCLTHGEYLDFLTVTV